MKYLCAVFALALMLLGCSCAPDGGDAADAGVEPEDTTPYTPRIYPEQTSDDPTYGYTPENPIKVGGPPAISGPASERVYLRHLRDSKSQPLESERLGSYGGNPDGHILDLYELTDSEGNKYRIYLDMYHEDMNPLDAKAPKGLYFWK